MKKYSLFLCFICVVLFSSCGTKVTKETIKKTQTTNSMSNSKVEYIEAKNYFVVNTYSCSELKSLKITTKSEFEEIFHPAPVMGTNGKATEIDFAKQFAIAVIHPETSSQCEVLVNSLNLTNNVLELSYSIKTGEKQSYTIQPFALLVVDKKYDEKLVASQK